MHTTKKSKRPCSLEELRGHHVEWKPYPGVAGQGEGTCIFRTSTNGTAHIHIGGSRMSVPRGCTDYACIRPPPTTVVAATGLRCSFEPTIDLTQLLKRLNGHTLYLLGDSVTLQFATALACSIALRWPDTHVLQGHTLARINMKWHDGNSSMARLVAMNHERLRYRNASAAVQMLFRGTSRDACIPNMLGCQRNATIFEAVQVLSPRAHDIVIAQTGLWWGKPEVFGRIQTREERLNRDATVRKMLLRTVQFVRQRGALFMWHEMPAQHFAGGAYMPDTARRCVSKVSVPSSNPHVPRVVHQTLTSQRVPQIPIYSATASMPPTAHCGDAKGTDCTHWCFSSGVAQLAARLIAHCVMRLGGSQPSMQSRISASESNTPSRIRSTLTPLPDPSYIFGLREETSEGARRVAIARAA